MSESLTTNALYVFNEHDLNQQHLSSLNRTFGRTSKIALNFLHDKEPRYYVNVLPSCIDWYPGVLMAFVQRGVGGRDK